MHKLRASRKNDSERNSFLKTLTVNRNNKINKSGGSKKHFTPGSLGNWIGNKVGSGVRGVSEVYEIAFVNEVIVGRNGQDNISWG